MSEDVRIWTCPDCSRRSQQHSVEGVIVTREGDSDCICATSGIHDSVLVSLVLVLWAERRGLR